MARQPVSHIDAFPGTDPPRVDTARHEPEVNLKAVVAASSQRKLLTRLVLLLTLAAGWTDALSYEHLGNVWASFMTGNILFIGISLAQGNGALLVRDVLVVPVFLCGITLGSLYLVRRADPQPALASRTTLARLLLLEGLLLLAFAILWQVTGDLATQPVTQVVLLCIAAFGMGLQGALVASFNLPNIVAVALTAVEVLLGMRLGHLIGGQTASEPGKTSSPFLLVLMLCYALAAFVAVRWIGTPFVPCIIVAVAILAVLATPERAAVPVQQA